MNLTPLQLDIMKWSDKTLSFGCIITGNICDDKGEVIDDTPMEYQVFVKELDHGYSTTRRAMTINGQYDIYNVIGHPINRGRVCYLLEIRSRQNDNGSFKLRSKVIQYIDDNKQEYYQKTVLDRPTDLQLLVLAFLKTLGT